MLKYFDLLSHKINSTIIFGGNNLGKRIIENLLKNNIQIIVVEEDLNLCQELSKEFPNIKVIYGNFGDNTFLKSLKIKQYDSVICATMQDQMNLIISLYAKNEGVKKVIARIDNIIYSNLLTQSKIDTQVSIDYLVFDEIFRNLKNIQTQNEIISKYELSKDIYAYEFNVDKNFPYLNVKIKDSKFKIKENILFGMIARNNQNIVVNGDTYLTEGDRVIVITTNEKLKQLKDILQ